MDHNRIGERSIWVCFSTWKSSLWLYKKLLFSVSQMFRTPLGPYFFSWYYSVIFLTEFEGWHLMFHLIIIFVCQIVAWKLYVCCLEEEKWWRKIAYQLKIVYYWFRTPCLLCCLVWGIVRSCGCPINSSADPMATTKGE